MRCIHAHFINTGPRLKAEHHHHDGDDAHRILRVMGRPGAAASPRPRCLAAVLLVVALLMGLQPTAVEAGPFGGGNKAAPAPVPPVKPRYMNELVVLERLLCPRGFESRGLCCR